MKSIRRTWRLSIVTLLVALLPAPPLVPAAVRQEGLDTQHLAGPAVSSPMSGDVTLLQWHRLNVGHNARKILMNWHNNNDGGHFHQILIAVEADGTTLGIASVIDGVPSQIARGVQSMTIGTWYYYAIARSGSTIELYVGSESSDVARAAALKDRKLTPQTNVWRWTAMGSSTATFSADTSIAQFRLYNRRLNPAQMDAERCSATPVSTRSLWTSNPFATAGSYGADAGFQHWLFREQGASNFSTVADPSPSCGGPGKD